MERYDVAIIGAGVTGAAAAAVLSRYQLRTVVLEKAADEQAERLRTEIGGLEEKASGLSHEADLLDAEVINVFQRLHHGS